MLWLLFKNICWEQKYDKAQVFFHFGRLKGSALSACLRSLISNVGCVFSCLSLYQTSVFPFFIIPVSSPSDALALNSTHFMPVHPIYIQTFSHTLQSSFKLLFLRFSTKCRLFFLNMVEQLISNNQAGLANLLGEKKNLKETVLQAKVYTNVLMFWHSSKQLKTW